MSGRPQILSPIVEGAGTERLGVEAIEATLDRVAAALAEFSAGLPVDELRVLGRLLDAVRDHPLIGDAGDPEALRLANQHIPEEVRCGRARGRAIADVVLRHSSPTGEVRDAEACGVSLGAKLGRFLESLDDAEAIQFRELLSNALGGLSPSGAVPETGWRAAAWEAAIECLTGTARCGATYVGRPPTIDAARLAQLVKEAGAHYWLAVRMGLRMTGPAGPVARSVGLDPALRRQVGETLGTQVEIGNGVTGSDNATYLYYDGAGDGVQPHVDPFGLVNALIMLERRAPSDGSPGSHLVLYQAGEPPRRIALEPGTMVILQGAGTVHAREPLGAGEQLTLLSLVFHVRSAGRPS